MGVSSTDNVFLQSTPNTQDDMVLRATPYLRFVHESPGIDAVVNYSFDWYRYTDLKQESSFHAYDGSLTGKLLDETLSLQLGANRRQVIKAPDTGIPTGRLPLTGNLADRDEVFVLPRFRKTFASAITLDASYRFADTQFNDSTIQDNENHEAKLLIENYARGSGITWALRYEQLETDYEVSPPWEYEKASAELGYWINEKLRLFGSGGKESKWDDLVDRSPQDAFWEGGLELEQGANLSAEFAVGERSFGGSWRGELDFTFRRGSTRLSYAETPTTVGFSRDQLPSTLIAPGDPDDFLTTPGQSESYIRNRLQWNLDLEFRRTNFGLSVFDEERSGRIDINGIPLADQSQSGILARFAWAVGPRTELVASGSLINREYSAGADSDFVRGGLEANYRLGSASQLSFVYDYSEQQPKGLSTNTDYAANVVSIFYTYAFDGFWPGTQ